MSSPLVFLILFSVLGYSAWRAERLTRDEERFRQNLKAVELENLIPINLFTQQKLPRIWIIRGSIWYLPDHQWEENPFRINRQTGDLVVPRNFQLIGRGFEYRLTNARFDELATEFLIKVLFQEENERPIHRNGDPETFFVTLIGRDATHGYFREFLPPEYWCRSIDECVLWLMSAEKLDSPRLTES